jgi:predicted nucleotidyltransferase
MNASEALGLDGLPAPVATVLTMFLASTREALSSDLVSAVLFGSAAEGRLAPASDVNLMLVLRSFTPDRIGAMRDALLNAEAAIKLRVMFVLESEVTSAAELFGQKFADILRRHRTIFGTNVLATLKVPRSAEIFRLKQILLNLVLRLREAYSARAHRPEQATRILTDALGPLRAACATLLELEGSPPDADSTKAFISVAASFGAEGREAAMRVLAAHNGEPIGADGEAAVFGLLTLATQVATRADRLT